MTTQTLSDTELSELLANEIPCQGIADPSCRRNCNKAAVLKSDGHGCPLTGCGHKCVECWQIWYKTMSAAIGRFGAIHCNQCLEPFVTVDSFSDYRPF